MDKKLTSGGELHRFPPESAEQADGTFLCGKQAVYAKLKIESKPGKRTVFLTEHTLIFVLKGLKLLHFGEETIEADANKIILLRKGIYAMAEYVEEGLNFEALMVFLPLKLVQSVAYSHPLSQKPATNGDTEPYVIVDTDFHSNAYKEQFRKYFDAPLQASDDVMPLKQQEILHLLLTGNNKERIKRFIHTLSEVSLQDIRFIVEQHLFQPISLPELANLCNRSLASFKRDFKILYNDSPRQWINTQRLKHAYMLLDNTNKTVAEISDACGFENTSYFTRLFKKQYNHAPRALKTKSAAV